MTVHNAGGRYAFTCSTTWQYINCDSYAWLINPPGLCTQELYGARLVMISFPGAHDPPGYLGTLQSSKTVTVASVAGTRKVYLVTKSNPLPPPKDTVQVLYTFKTGGRTYYFEYDLYAGDADSTAEFDRMVTQTVAFSA